MIIVQMKAEKNKPWASFAVHDLSGPSVPARSRIKH